MKFFVYGWLMPVGFLIGWYALSYNDMSFGMYFFSRELHDKVFEIYGNLLGIPPADLPKLVFKAIAVDSLFVFGLALLSRWRALTHFVRTHGPWKVYSSAWLVERALRRSSAP